jgi:Xaa-Pro dipeptidase
LSAKQLIEGELMPAENDDPIRTEVPKRQRRVREEMARRNVDALILTSRANFEYFTGFRSTFWASTTRPFYSVILRDSSSCIILVHRAEERSTAFDHGNAEFVFYTLFLNDALRTLAELIAKRALSAKRIAIDYGDDIFGRGSLTLVDALRGLPGNPEVLEGDQLIWAVRLIKSEYEIQMKRRACHIATDSFFEPLPNLRLGQTEKEFGRAITINMLNNGADYVDFLPVHFGKSGLPYIRPASERRLEQDDFVWVDMGCVYNDYHSDLNRIAKAGETSESERAAYRFVREVTIELAKRIRPGMPCPEVVREFDKLWTPGAFGKPYGNSARIGHGSGLGLTEPPSLMQDSTEVIQAGMILHLEPKIETDKGVFQVEEVFVVRENGVEFLSDLAPKELPTVSGTH